MSMSVQQMSDTSWLIRPRPNPRARARLFCLPYAGGSAYIFNDWAQGLSPDVELCAVQLPGRGKRLREDLARRMQPLAAALAQNIRPFLEKPFVFFGHSLGAMLSFELARALRREHAPLPAHLFVSGRRAVQLPIQDLRTYDLPEDEFIKELDRLNGTPKGVLEHAELLRLLLPTLRADFEVVQTYEYVSEPPFQFPITAFGGLDDDEYSGAQLDAWRDQTTSDFRLYMLPGDHFFLHTERDSILKVINRALSTAG